MIVFYDPLRTTLKFPNQPPFRHMNPKSYVIRIFAKDLEEKDYENIVLVWNNMHVRNYKNFWKTQSVQINEIKNVIQKGNVQFYFNCYDSGCSPTEIMDSCIDTSKKLGLKTSQITLVTGNTYEKFVLEQMFIGRGYLDIKFESGDREVVNGCADYTEYLQKQKRFIFMSRRCSPFRTLIFFDLCRREILTKDNAIFTWSRIDPYSEEIISTEDVIRSVNQILSRSNNKEYVTEMLSWIEQNAKKLCEDSPYTIPGELAEKQDQLNGRNYKEYTKKNYPAVFQNTGNALANAINGSAVSLSIETQYNDDNPETFHMTEKTIRTLFFKMPFFNYSNPTFLAKFKAQGFKTFSDYWDESYDQEFDPVERMLKINNQVEQLNDMSWWDFHNLIADTADVTNHNYKQMWKLMKNYRQDFIDYKSKNKLIWNDADGFV